MKPILNYKGIHIFSAFLILMTLVSGCQHTLGLRKSDPVTKFVNVEGVKFAYRKFGKESPIPLVFFQHFRGTMDNWDPLLISEISKHRTVILFNNRGVSSSEGETPDTFEKMADDAAKFIHALGYSKVDILGFSIGGAVAQELLRKHPNLAHQAILAGTSAQGGKGLNKRDERIIAVATKSKVELEDFLILFFEKTASSQKLGQDYINRRRARKEADPASSLQTMIAQSKARKAWGEMVDPNFSILKNIPHRVLVANGSNDIMMPTINSYELFQNLPNAQLILYPDSGHGFLFQYPIEFAQHINVFLQN